MLIYVFVIIIVSFFCLLERKKLMSKKLSSFFFWVIVFLLALVAALRSKNVGVDTLQYYRTYSFYLNDSWDFSHIRYEIGYSYFVKILTLFSEDPQLLLIVSSFFINFSVGFFINKNSNSPFLSLLIYILMGFWMSYMNILRQALAVSMVLIGFTFLKKKGFWAIAIFELFVALGTSFHSVAIFACIIPIFKYIKHNRYSLVFTLGIGLFLFFTARDLFSFMSTIANKYSGYSINEYSKSNYFGALINLLFGIYIVSTTCYYFKNIISRRKYHLQEDVNIYLSLAFIYIFCLFMVVQMAIFNRLSNLFSIFLIVEIPLAFSYCRKKDKFLQDTLIFVLFCYFFIIAIFRPEWNGCIPYEFFF